MSPDLRVVLVVGLAPPATGWAASLIARRWAYFPVSMGWAGAALGGSVVLAMRQMYWWALIAAGYAVLALGADIVWTLMLEAGEHMALKNGRSGCPGHGRHWFTVYGEPGIRTPNCFRCGSPNPRRLSRDQWSDLVNFWRNHGTFAGNPQLEAAIRAHLEEGRTS